MPQPAVVIPRSARNFHRGARRDRLIPRRFVCKREAHCLLERMQVVEIVECDPKAVDNALQRVKRKVGQHLATRAVLDA